jgi:hypothetical protein
MVIGIVQYSPGTSTHTSFRIHIVNTYRHPRTYAHTLSYKSLSNQDIINITLPDILT